MDDITISQLRAFITELEEDMRQAATAAVEKFKKNTGRSPDYIYIDLVDITRLGYSPERIVDRVRAHVEI